MCLSFSPPPLAAANVTDPVRVHVNLSKRDLLTRQVPSPPFPPISACSLPTGKQPIFAFLPFPPSRQPSQTPQAAPSLPRHTDRERHSWCLLVSFINQSRRRRVTPTTPLPNHLLPSSRICFSFWPSVLTSLPSSVVVAPWLLSRLANRHCPVATDGRLLGHPSPSLSSWK